MTHPLLRPSTSLTSSIPKSPVVGDGAQATVRPPEHDAALQTILTQLQQQQLEQGEMTRTLDAVRRALKAMQVDDAQLRANVQGLQIMLEGDDSLAHKLELTLPLIPLFLDYKIELGSNRDLAAIQAELGERWRALQKGA